MDSETTDDLVRRLSAEISHLTKINPTVGCDEAAEIMKCHPDTIRKMAKAGEIPGTKVGRSWVFSTERLLQWLDARIQSAELKSRFDGHPTNSLAERLAERLKRRRSERIKSAKSGV